MASKKKRKTLPKNFKELLENGALEPLQAVFETCELDATFGSSKETALMLFKCPDDFTRWLVAQGARLDVVDAYGHTPLHAQARSYLADLTVLLRLGADPHANTTSLGTPLHEAVDAKHVKHVDALLAAGAHINVTNKNGLTPLELGLERASNIDLVRLAVIAKKLLDAGAPKTPRMKDAVERLGKNFEFSRAGFARDSVQETSDALAELYALFDVTPVAARAMHDGTSRITVKAKTWQEQHQELWQLLVPSTGAAKTVQGEVTRIAGKIHRELQGNGGANWDGEYRKMCDAFLAHVPFDADVMKRIRTGNGSDDDMEELVRASVQWVLTNPKPVSLGPVNYQR